MTEFVRTRIKEPFPLFYSHVAFPQERDRGTAEGPFYAAGSEWFEIYDGPRTLNWKERAAIGLRRDGWTVTVDLVTR